MDISFVGKRVLVTGAGRGIGRAISKLLASLNATVIALARTTYHHNPNNPPTRSLIVSYSADVSTPQLNRSLVMTWHLLPVKYVKHLARIESCP
jgi:NAD(P)-dependent dehydrogenase (short-subunit alcohol dehydrogenase family)